MSETINAYKVGGATVEHDEEGYIKDIAEWTPDLAEVIAKAEDLEMTPERWQVVNFLREYYKEYQIAPAIRVLMKEMTKRFGKEKGNQQYLDSLFPKGPAKEACKIAGLPKPTGCV